MQIHSLYYKQGKWSRIQKGPRLEKEQHSANTNWGLENKQ